MGEGEAEGQGDGGESPRWCVGLVDIRGVLLFGDRGEMVASIRAKRHREQLEIDWLKGMSTVAAETARIAPLLPREAVGTTAKPTDAYKPIGG